MYAKAQGELVLRVALDVEPVRIPEMPFIAVRRAQQQDDLLAERKFLPLEHHGFSKPARLHLRGRLHAQHFKYGPREQVHIGEQFLPLIRILRQQYRALCNRVDDDPNGDPLIQAVETVQESAAIQNVRRVEGESTGTEPGQVIPGKCVRDAGTLAVLPG